MRFHVLHNFGFIIISYIVHRLVDFDQNGEIIFNDESAKKSCNESRVDFKFDRKKYIDAVVIPYYRNNDITPQFYCVVKIDDAFTPDSAFPSSASSKSTRPSSEIESTSSHCKPSAYASFAHYFGYKYNIRITDLEQPLLLVSHPSTRLNLLTPRYMNMKATVLQKSSLATHVTRVSGNGTSKKSSSHQSSNQIYLVPELVNVHPLKASLWKRCMCLPSILFRLNCLLLAEELRREIASGTGVGFPWVDDEKVTISVLFYNTV